MEPTERYEVDFVIDFVKLKTMGRLLVVLGEGLIGLSSVLESSDEMRRREASEGRYIEEFNEERT